MKRKNYTIVSLAEIRDCALLDGDTYSALLLTTAIALGWQEMGQPNGDLTAATQCVFSNPREATIFIGTVPEFGRMIRGIIGESAPLHVNAEIDAIDTVCKEWN